MTAENKITKIQEILTENPELKETLSPVEKAVVEAIA